MKINRHDQAKILSPYEIAWLFDGKVGLVSDLKLFRLLIWLGWKQGMEAIASLSMLSYIKGLPTERDWALFGICLYTAARINEACLLHTADVYGTDGRVRNRITFRRATTKETGDAIGSSVAGVEAIVGRISKRLPLPVSRSLGQGTHLPGVCRCHFTGSL